MLNISCAILGNARALRHNSAMGPFTSTKAMGLCLMSCLPQYPYWFIISCVLRRSKKVCFACFPGKAYHTRVYQVNQKWKITRVQNNQSPECRIIIVVTAIEKIQIKKKVQGLQGGRLEDWDDQVVQHSLINIICVSIDFYAKFPGIWCSRFDTRVSPPTMLLHIDRKE